jgi:ribose/xylose/arabinose/galactoside ABC-type transport system permease subunit
MGEAIIVAVLALVLVLMPATTAAVGVWVYARGQQQVAAEEALGSC